ncbi:hypothetical protein ACFO0A_14760 [Novosphingobium tardum]|uniref:Alginate lyase domain-containing protein n=1 Tax=Novosphingobium tardum TaxID=1538021 RepID=A0ABV8RSD9_9SPHN
MNVASLNSISIENADFAVEALGPKRARPLLKIAHGSLSIEIAVCGDGLWTSFRRSDDGGLALRTPLLSCEVQVRSVDARDGEAARIECQSSLGKHEIVLVCDPGPEEMFRLTVSFAPDRPLHVPYMPRDVVPFDHQGRPDRTSGNVEAKQRRLNTGLLYFSCDKPALGKVLYVQNLTALNGYFLATETIPENAVGGVWPELGFLPPTHPEDPAKALPAGDRIVSYDTILSIRAHRKDGESESAWQFLDMLGSIYRWLDKPEAPFRDWVGRAQRTLADLSKSPKARLRHYGNLYFHPYTDAEYPDIMVQLSLLSAIHDWGMWSGRKHRLEAQVVRGLARFYDRGLGALRRYLPSVGDDKDADAVDSWYLYHPLLNLANLALGGDEKARELFLKSVDYGIRSAQHFKYKWPIQYKIDTFEVITAVAADDRGQTDVGGVYAWVMLQGYELTGEQRFIDEAKAAIAAARGMRFHLNYQANLTAWGAAACIRLWRITNDMTYLTQSYVYLASFFHNCQIWESDIGNASLYSNFLGATCLQDAPYMAIYECFDSFAAFERYLDLGGPDLIPSAKLLVGDYCRFALSRAWNYYPDTLPPEALATECRNGHIDRALSFPVEDLYPDGQPAGQVGQEIYGSGAAMVFATRAFHAFPDMPFLIHCDHFIRAPQRITDTIISFSLDGAPGANAHIRIVRNKGRLPKVMLHLAEGEEVKPASTSPKLIEFEVPALSAVSLSWE